jgi:indole-3-glycerol phosphate synthase
VSILDEILDWKREEVARAKTAIPAAEMAERARRRPDEPLGLRRALVTGPEPRVIAEIKRRSPSRGEIRADFDPEALARAYAGAGAAAISVLTDERYFGGRLEYLGIVRAATGIPLLRKDFTIDPYQIDEARAHGADAILLIVAAFRAEGDFDRLQALHRRATGLGLDTLVEVHDDAELDVALALGADLVGVNNRNLATFEVDLATTEKLAARVPEGVVLVAESGIFTHHDIRRLARAGAGAFLVGESLMREADVASALNNLRRNS